ncbi:MAG: A/G-specific adenine glycosylase [Gemmatimonadota bacterium]|nr:A/G-specific adenine glycosylase [Gemmatimonadota bacterium]
MKGPARGPEGVAAFRGALLAHFDRNRRALPWRVGRTPYRVMVSEFMLQQTRVETVVPYYERWMRRFPDWDALAGAEPDDVILEWKGLGYYARARNLHRTALAVRERYGGRLPADPEELRTLPGVGEYTAGAVASIAFGRAVPAVDGNVKRVLARLLDLERPAAGRLRREAARLVDPNRPGDFNEAMMELGAMVCAPRSPRCAECPVAGWCRARMAGTVGERPARGRGVRGRGVRRVEYAVAVLVDEAGRTLLVRRPPEGLLAGMWEFPAVRVGEGAGGVGGGGLPVAASHVGPAESLPVVHHAFTHLRAAYRPVIIRVPRSTRRVGCPSHHAPAAWVHHAHLDEWALPVAQQKIGALLTEWLARPGDGPLNSPTACTPHPGSG